jgi:hypothetical protein
LILIIIFIFDTIFQKLDNGSPIYKSLKDWLRERLIVKAGVGEEVIRQYILKKGIHHDAVISRDPSTIQSIKRRKQK